MEIIISLFISILIFINANIMGKSISLNILGCILISLIFAIMFVLFKYKENINTKNLFCFVFMYSFLFIFINKLSYMISIYVSLLYIIFNTLIYVYTIKNSWMNYSSSLEEKNSMLLKNWNSHFYKKVNKILEEHNIFCDIYVCENEYSMGGVTIINKEKIIYLNKRLFDLNNRLQKMIILHEIGHYNSNHTEKTRKSINIYVYFIIPTSIIITFLFVYFINFQFSNIFFVFISLLSSASIFAFINLLKTKHELEAEEYMITYSNLKNSNKEDIFHYVLYSKEFLKTKTNKFNLFMYSLFYGYPSKEHLLLKLKDVLDKKDINYILNKLEKFKYLDC